MKRRIGEIVLRYLLSRQGLAVLLLALTGFPPTGIASVTEDQIDFALGELDKLAPELLQRSGVPGMAIAVVTGDEILYERGFGVRESGIDEPVDRETVFQLASLSKPLTSTVVAGLVGDSILDWDTPVTRFLTEFALADPWVTGSVTIADMLSHRSGLPSHAGDLLEDLGFEQDEVLQHLRCSPLSPFRTTYAYTNFGFTVGALAAAAAVEMDWADLAKQRLFDPLGMHRSSYRYADYLAEPNRVSPHAYVDGIYQPLYHRDADAQAPAGGASASIDDLANWLRLQLGEGRFAGEQLVGADALLQTQLPQSISNPAATVSNRSGFYGLGWNVGYDDAGRVRLNHTGAFLLGAATSVTLYPGEDIGILVLTNGAPYGLAEATARSFFDLLFEGELKDDWLPWFFDAFSRLWAEERAFMRDYSTAPANPAPPRDQAAYSGVYYNPYYGPLQIFPQGDELLMVFGPRTMTFPLRHWNGNLFIFETTGENAVGLSGAEFILGPRGHAESLILERYNEIGLGVFGRIPEQALQGPWPQCVGSYHTGHRSPRSAEKQ